MPGMELRSHRHRVDDADAALELFHERGWTDGLPIVPPTEERVLRMLAGAGRAAGDVVGLYPSRRRVILAEKVAINAVMAGCRPEHLPVVLARGEAMADERMPAHAYKHQT